jgi:hypothetical protein
MVVPFADCLNHAPADIHYELYNPKIHSKESTDEAQSSLTPYYTKAKMKVNFQDLNTDHSLPLKTVTRTMFVDDDVTNVFMDGEDINAIEKANLNIWNL